MSQLSVLTDADLSVLQDPNTHLFIGLETQDANGQPQVVEQVEYKGGVYHLLDGSVYTGQVGLIVNDPVVMGALAGQQARLTATLVNPMVTGAVLTLI